MPCIKCKKTAVCSNLCRSHFMQYLEKKVSKTIKKFGLLTHKNKIGVAVSGGKDSTVVLYLLHKLGYPVVGLTVDAVIGNYTKTNLENLRKVCKKYNIPLHEISFKKEFGYSLCYIRSVLKDKGYNFSSCLICGVLRRFLLNKYAKLLKLGVLVTGHNLDDEAQTFLMNIFRNDIQLSARQGPITGLVKDKRFVKRVKPLYLCTEREITTYSKLMKFPVNYEICPCSSTAYRRQYINILNEFEKKHPDVKYKIVNYFLQIMPLLKKSQGKGLKIGTCKYCGEPSNRDVCKVCEIISCLRSKGKKTKRK